MARMVPSTPTAVPTLDEVFNDSVKSAGSH
jgi:hypothetical protein